MGNYNFDEDLKEAEIVETQVIDFLIKVYGMTLVSRHNDNTKDCVMMTAGGKLIRIEIKNDKKCVETSNVAVEFGCRKKYSGIRTTQAQFYTYKISLPDGTFGVYTITVPELKQMIADYLHFRDVLGGDKNKYTGKPTTWMHLFKLEVVKQHWKFLGNLSH